MSPKTASAADDLGAAQATSRPYRKVVFPTRGGWQRARRQNAGSGIAAASGSGDLVFGGGAEGIGVVTGPPRAYVVFWGSQWGASSTNGSGFLQFGGDAAHMAPFVQAMFAGLGTAGELWSAVNTQYCEGIASGTSSCALSITHVAPADGNVLAGVWYDNAGAAPAQATDDQIALEAAAAAAHFGNTAPGANRNAQYVVVSPSGTHPGGFLAAGDPFCAWHAALSTSAGPIAFTNLPYVPDASTSCGRGFVHAGSVGALDGVSIVAGHEFAETLTDPVPGGGWTDSVGYEEADKCAWIAPGSPGGAADVAFTTGIFPMQSLWSNDDHDCVLAHAVVTNDVPVRIAAVGAEDARGIMDRVLTDHAGYDVPAIPLLAFLVPADLGCGALAFGPGGLVAPADAPSALDALSGSEAGTYPDGATGAGRGCVDIARVDRDP